MDINIIDNNSFNPIELSEIKENIKQLHRIRVGEVVSDRDMGIDWSCLDNKEPIARMLYTTEVIEKIERYEPRATVTRIDFDTNQDSMTASIFIEKNLDYTEDSEDIEDEEDMEDEID